MSGRRAKALRKAVSAVRAMDSDARRNAGLMGETKRNWHRMNRVMRADKYAPMAAALTAAAKAVAS